MEKHEGIQAKLVASHFRILNYRNIDDSGPIPLERVTAFVGRNESGKTALLKALHKFNPATPEPYVPQKEFPRDRFTAEFTAGDEWPVCEVKFLLSKGFQDELREQMDGVTPPKTATCTRYYDGSLAFEYDQRVTDKEVDPTRLFDALEDFAKEVRRIASPSTEQQEETKKLRAALGNWSDEQKDNLREVTDLKTSDGVEILKAMRMKLNELADPMAADVIESLKETVEELLVESETKPIPEIINEAIEEELPVFVYFENYGILDSAVYLPRLLEDIDSKPNDARVRTVNAMFKHVTLSAKEIVELGVEKAAALRNEGQPVTAEANDDDRERKELRAVKLNSASLDITKRFGDWFKQRRHNIKYDVDGDYFRIWVSDDRRPGVDIELESRSKGFQWFFSFYLVFLVESAEGHKDAVLLLDEPGLHLHPTAQQELIDFFEDLSERNQLLYSTHSPFLVDGERIHRVRPVTEDETGHSRISVDSWPQDRETIFPLQAAAGYAMVRGLFRHKKNVLVEGMADYLYMHSLNLACRALGKTALPDDIYVTPCGGTKLVGHLASLFLGQEVRPVVLLDGDDAGRVRRDALMKELYSGHERAVLMLSDVLATDECEVEDIIGEATFMPVLNEIVDKKVTLNAEDRKQGSLPDQVKSAAERHKVELPIGWKSEVARRIVVKWASIDANEISTGIVDRMASLFEELNRRFEDGVTT